MCGGGRATGHNINFVDALRRGRQAIRMGKWFTYTTLVARRFMRRPPTSEIHWNLIVWCMLTARYCQPLMSTHFHILWNGTSLDWERYVTHAAADANARELIRDGETYTIKEVSDGSCEICKAISDNPH